MTYRQFHKMQLDIIIIILFSQPRLRARIAEGPFTRKGPWPSSAGSPSFKRPTAQRTGPFCPYGPCARTRLRFPCSKVSARKPLGVSSCVHFQSSTPGSVTPDYCSAREKWVSFPLGAHHGWVGQWRPLPLHPLNTSSPAPFGHPAWSYPGLAYQGLLR